MTDTESGPTGDTAGTARDPRPADGATRVLVLNSGSSSVKYQLLDMADGSRPASGIVERIGEGPVADHAEALKRVADELAERGAGSTRRGWRRSATAWCTAARCSPSPP
ncbi:hypothetical protein NKH77_36245 [Streptomyces sp. M19]